MYIYKLDMYINIIHHIPNLLILRMAPVHTGRTNGKGPLHGARLENALGEIKNGMPLREAAKRFCVSRGALEYHRRWKGRRGLYLSLTPIVNLLEHRKRCLLTTVWRRQGIWHDDALPWQVIIVLFCFLAWLHIWLTPRARRFYWPCGSAVLERDFLRSE